MVSSLAASEKEKMLVAAVIQVRAGYLLFSLLFTLYSLHSPLYSLLFTLYSLLSFLTHQPFHSGSCDADKDYAIQRYV